MRALIGLLILGSLFVMAASWQNRTTSRLRGDRAQGYNVASDSVRPSEGWSQLIVGRPSGADPLPVPEQVALPGGSGVNAGNGAQPQGPRPLEADNPSVKYRSDRIYVVQSNDVLSKICQDHYDARPLEDVIARVATYNDLKSPDAIRAGIEIRLPDAAVLFPER